MYICIVLCAPTKSASSKLLNVGTDLTMSLPLPSDYSDLGNLGLSSKNVSTDLGWEKMTWKINDNLSLALTVCNWQLSPETILAVLAAAEVAVGKKPGAGLLDKKFTQRSDNKYNTLHFEIRPDYTNKRLTWGDVGEVLGENGLSKFYTTTNAWHTAYFDVVHTTKGELGSGAVRRWWQLNPPSVWNSTALGNGGVRFES